MFIIVVVVVVVVVVIAIVIIIIFRPSVLNSQRYKILKIKQDHSGVYSMVKVLWKETAFPR